MTFQSQLLLDKELKTPFRESVSRPFIGYAPTLYPPHLIVLNDYLTCMGPETKLQVLRMALLIRHLHVIPLLLVVWHVSWKYYRMVLV